MLYVINKVVKNADSSLQKALYIKEHCQQCEVEGSQEIKQK
jgi:hypothetical protein